MEDGCCNLYVFCISCCLGGGTNRTGLEDFEDCRQWCRTSSRTLIYDFDAPESDVAREFRHCYQEPRRAPGLHVSMISQTDHPFAKDNLEDKSGKSDAIQWAKI
jgi:hypothetical protein